MNNDSMLALRVASGATFMVPANLRLLTPYVLLEQEDWFEDETGFVRRMLAPGGRVLDVGANYGVYTVAAAESVGAQGQVYALEPCTDTFTCLAATLAANALDQVSPIKCALSDFDGEAGIGLSASPESNSLSAAGTAEHVEQVPVLTLDTLATRHDVRGIDFFKLDAEGEESRIIAAGREFLAAEDPLLMVEFRHGERVNMPLIDALGELGYATYRLVPGLQLLIPFDPGAPADKYQLNLFACKSSRAGSLSERGLLVAAGRAPDVGVTVRNALAAFDFSSLPHAGANAPAWARAAASAHDAAPRVMAEVLVAWTLATRVEDRASDQRLALLEWAFGRAQEAAALAPDLPVLLSLVRLAGMLGLREQAFEYTNTFINGIHADAGLDTGVPFIPANAAFDAVPCPRRDASDWMMASLLDARTCSAHFSTYFDPDLFEHNLRILDATGYARPRMWRALVLLCALRGKPVPGEHRALLAHATADNRNPSVWPRLEALFAP